MAFIGAGMARIGDFVEDGLRLSATGPAVFFPGMLALGTGLALLGIGTLTAKAFPRWFGVLLALSPIVGFFLGGLWAGDRVRYSSVSARSRSGVSFCSRDTTGSPKKASAILSKRAILARIGH
jgi:hypothetical protein